MISPLALPPSSFFSRERTVLFSSRASPPSPPTSPISFLSLSPPGLPVPSRGRGGGNPRFNPFPYNFLPMHREKLARNTHAHARKSREKERERERTPSSFPLVHWRSPIIRFHRIFVVRAQASGPDTNPPINPVSVGDSQLSPAVREVRSKPDPS